MWFHHLSNWFERFARLIGTLAGLALVLMMLHVVADVVLKFVFNRPIPGTPETVAFYYMVAAVFLPLAYVELKGRHITVDLVYNCMPRSVQRVMLGFACLCSALFFALLTYQSWQDAVSAYQIGQVAMGAIALPIWPSRFVLPTGFALITIASLIRFVSEALLNRDLAQDEKGIEALLSEGENGRG